ncbi:hypothetical protein EXS65_04740 [Candidatus Peribacteria bacterium]|nr:hypothetical protein [Candidatus Peribacteria bacterium]
MPNLKFNFFVISSLFSLILILSGSTTARANNSFVDGTEAAITKALNALRAQTKEDSETVTFSSKENWIQKFEFPASWVATYGSAHSVLHYQQPTHHDIFSKKLDQLIYDKGDANVRDGKKLRLAFPLSTVIARGFQNIDGLLITLTKTQAIFLRPLQGPGSIDDWSNTMVMFRMTSALAFSSSSATKPTDAEIIDSVIKNLSPHTSFNGGSWVSSIQDITVTNGVLGGQPSKIVSFLYPIKGILYRSTSETTELSDGTKIELNTHASEKLVSFAQRAAETLRSSLVFSVSPETSSSSSMSSSRSAVSFPSKAISVRCRTPRQKRMKQCQIYHPSSSAASAPAKR